MATGTEVMIIEDVLGITGRGTVLLGRILIKTIHIGQNIEIDPGFTGPLKAKVVGIQAFKKSQLKSASFNQYVGLQVSIFGSISLKKGMRIYLSD